LVGATQHFVFLVRGGRARGKTRGDHDRANYRYRPFHSLTLARTDIREIPGQNRASEKLKQAQMPPGASKKRSKPAIDERRAAETDVPARNDHTTSSFG